jgi:hypothetical protein
VRRRTTAALLVCIATCSITASTVDAQTRRGTSTPTRSGIPVLRNSGKAKVDEPDERPTRAARSLSAAQLSQMLGPLGFTLANQLGPWKLSLNERTAAGGRIRLSFWNVERVKSTNDVVRMKGFSRIYITIQALAADEYFLVQCAVSGGDNPNPRFWLFGPGDNETMTNGNNVVAVYHSLDTQKAILHVMPVSQGFEWDFSHCEVSQLQPPQTPR